MTTYTTYSDGQLLSLLRLSDESAFTEIYERYWKKLFAVAMHKTASQQDAEDIVHEILISIWQRREIIQIENLSPYLGASVKYKVLEYFNKKLNAVELNAAGHKADLSIVSYLDEKIILNMLKEEINLLPEKCRLVFIASRFEGKSNPEIAAELNISRKAVEKHISAAIKHLRPSFKDLMLWAAVCKFLE